MIPQHGTLEISRSRLLHNLALLRGLSGHAKICATVKADAYGHGQEIIVPTLVKAGIEWFCFYSWPEIHKSLRYLRLSRLAGDATQTPKALLLAPLVITGHETLEPSMLRENVRFNLIDIASTKALNRFAQNQNSPRNIPVHVQVDTGLTRMGILPEHAPALLQAIHSMKHLRLEGVFSHFSHGDEPGHPSVAQQYRLLQTVADIAHQWRPDLLIHLQNSGGLLNLPTTSTENLDLVRIGIALYGLQPSTQHPIPGLQPIAQLTAPILAIHNRPPGTGVGYGHTYTTTRPSRLAVVPVGYADGYPRQLSNTKNAIAQIRDIDIPVVGRVSMDQIILDITDLPTEGDLAPQLGDIVTVISSNPTKPNSLDQMADAIGTIGYELATHLGPRLHRVIVD